MAGTVTVTVPRHGTQPGRTATLTVQFTAVTLKPPRHRAQEPLPRIPVDGVLARESAPPAVVKWASFIVKPVRFVPQRTLQINPIAAGEFL
ncbi:MAG: hypothetical protein U1F76_02860 [Candidatus Competibacteraceae bacterium]